MTALAWLFRWPTAFITNQIAGETSMARQPSKSALLRSKATPQSRVTSDIPLRPDQLQMDPPWGATKATARKLVSELARVEARHVDFLEPAKPGSEC
jgi:hypothetical protein